MSFCGECGFEVNSSEKFCRNCGNKYDVESNFVEPEAPDNTEHQAEEVVEELDNLVGETPEKNIFEKDIPVKKKWVRKTDVDYFNKKNIKIAIPIILMLLVPTVIYPYYHVWWANVDSIEPNDTQNDGIGFSSGSADLLAVFWDDMDHTSLEYSLDKFDFVYEYQIYAKSDDDYNQYSALTEEDLVLEESCKFSVDSECKLQLVRYGKTGQVFASDKDWDQCWVPMYSPLYIGRDSGFSGEEAARAQCGMTYPFQEYRSDFYWHSGFGIVENNYNIYDPGSEDGLPLYFELRISFFIETNGIVPSPPSNAGGGTIQIDMLDYDKDLVNDYDDGCPEEYALTSNGCP